VIFDRDGTIVFDVPYNGDPDAVRPVPGMREALDRLRRAKIPIGVVSNQSGVARGTITIDQVEAVNRRIDDLLGPFDAWLYCPHGPQDDCECRKPKPKMIVDAAARMGVDPACCVVIGDKPSDVEAAENAGAGSIFVDDPYGAIDAIEMLLSSNPSPER
jgi:D-glycero-D-manno-heptose 1,7-bisphosphate phosphatase